MSDTTAVPTGGINRGAFIIALGWVFTGLALLTVSLWIYARWRKGLNLGWDVWFMIIALVMRITAQVIATPMLNYGFGKHDIELTPDDVVMILKLNWMQVLPLFVGSLLARFSITILLIKLFGIHKWFRVFLISLAALLTAVTIAATVIIFGQYSPIQALWNFHIVPTRRWDPRIYLDVGYLVNACYTFSDLAYVLFPVIIIWKLHMPLRRRIGLMLMMALSLFTMSMSILRMIWIPPVGQKNSKDTDVQYKYSFEVLWNTLEACFVIIMGCIPSIRTLFTGDSPRRSLVGSYWTVSRKVLSSGKKLTNSDTVSSAGDSEMTRAEHGKGLYLDPREESRHVTVSAQRASGSDDRFEAENDQILRTAEWTVTYTDTSDTRNTNK